MIKSDVIALLTQENPFISELSPATQTAIFEIGVGGMVMLYRHVDRSVLLNHLMKLVQLCVGFAIKVLCIFYFIYV